MGILATDNFNRANENPATGWTTLTGATAFKVVSNAVTPVGTGEVAAYYTGVTPPADHYSQCAIGSLASGSGAGPAVRLQTGSLGGYLLSAYGASGGGLFITKDDATLVGSALSTEPHVAGDVYRLEVQGTTLRAYRNNTLKITATDSTYATGQFGMWWFENVNGTTGDDWEGGDFNNTPTNPLQINVSSLRW